MLEYLLNLVRGTAVPMRNLKRRSGMLECTSDLKISRIDLVVKILFACPQYIDVNAFVGQPLRSTIGQQRRLRSTLKYTSYPI